MFARSQALWHFATASHETDGCRPTSDPGVHVAWVDSAEAARSPDASVLATATARNFQNHRDPAMARDSAIAEPNVIRPSAKQRILE
jgi:hypothetical protein